MNAKQFVDMCAAECAEVFERLDAIEEHNTEKVLKAFQEERVSMRHFAQTTGYGYDDIGRDTLGTVFSKVFGCESALVRPQIASGTHALGLCLYGILRPGDIMLAATGKPYDTMEDIIGLSEKSANMGTLKDFGVRYKQVDLVDGKPSIPHILDALEPAVKLVHIQRSRGYDWRNSLSVKEINDIIDAIHAIRSDICVMLDNCYGEFTDYEEPHADLFAGSLIKNAGGGLAPTGGYIAGKAKWVEMVSYRLTTPGIGAEVGSYCGGYQPFYQGFFMAPHVTMQAIRTSVLAARVFERLGYEVSPSYKINRNDIIQAIRFDDRDKLIRFCQAIQASSPIDSEALPEPWDMPGYQDQVIMAAGTFVGGASIELSADAPVKPPYNCYMQGGLTYTHGKLAITNAVRAIHGDNIEV